MYIYISKTRKDSRLNFVFIIFLALVRALSFACYVLVFLRSSIRPTVRPVCLSMLCVPFECLFRVYTDLSISPSSVTGLHMNLHAWLTQNNHNNNNMERKKTRRERKRTSQHCGRRINKKKKNETPNGIENKKRKKDERI